VYFEEFQRQAAIYWKESRNYPEKKDDHKNLIYSAKGLEALVAMAPLLIPVSQERTLHSNLSQRRNAITQNGIKIGAMEACLYLTGLGSNMLVF
jgi:hypothetical protein